MEGDENVWVILPREIVVTLTEYLSLQDVGRLASASCVLLDIIVQNNMVWKEMCTRKPISLKTILAHVKFGRTWESTNNGGKNISYENEPAADQFNYRLLLKEYFMLAVLRTKLRDFIRNYSHPVSWAEIGIRQEDSTSQDQPTPIDTLLRCKLYYIVFAKPDSAELLPTEFRGIRLVYGEEKIEDKVSVLSVIGTAVDKVASVWRMFTKQK